MNKLDVKKYLKDLKALTIKHSPEILTGVGIAGMITSTVFAVKATPKALRLIEEAEEEKNEELTTVEVVKVAWKPYIPSVLIGASSVACLIGASSVNSKRNAALATAYNLSRTALNEYKEKVVETIGEKKEQAIKDKINQDRVEKNPVSTSEIYISSNSETLCYDALSGRYFKSDIETIKKAINQLNYRMVSEMYISLSEFYDEIGLSHTKNSDYLGWNINVEGLIDVNFGSHIADNGQPCVVVDYLVGPRYEYDKLM